MIRTRSRVTSPGHQESRDASSNPHRGQQLAPIMQPPSIQHIQSMATAMAKLTLQNQELTREISLRRQLHERHAEGQAQSQENRGNAKPKSQSRGTTSRRVPHLEREMDQMKKVMVEMRENIRKANLVDNLVHRTDSLSQLPSTVIPCLLSSRCLSWTHMMERTTLLIILLLSRLRCTFVQGLPYYPQRASTSMIQ